MTTIKIYDGTKEIGTGNWISYAAERKMAPIYTFGEEWYKEKYLNAPPKYYGTIETDVEVNEGEFYTIIIEQEQHGERKQTVLEQVELFHRQNDQVFFIASGLEFRSKITWYQRARIEIGHTGRVIKTEE